MSFLQNLSHYKEQDEHTFEVAFDSSWTQGRTLFGGAVGALAHNLMGQKLGDAWGLRSIMVDFLAPITAQKLVVKVEVIRQGRTLVRIQAQFYQQEKYCCIALGVFGRSRSGAFPVAPASMPPVKPASECLGFPEKIGPIPEFAQYFDYRWAKTNFPYSGSTDSVLLGWIQPRNQKVNVDYLIAMIDAWPPPILSLSDRPFPVSSVNWLLNIHQGIPAEGLPKEDWYLFESKLQFANEGCMDLTARLWDQKGNLLGISRQLLVEFSDKVFTPKGSS